MYKKLCIERILKEVVLFAVYIYSNVRIHLGHKKTCACFNDALQRQLIKFLIHISNTSIQYPDAFAILIEI